jgi:hypothetical protein
MKIDVYEHVIALDTAVGKTKLFFIGMSASTTSTFPIKYVLKKSFTVDTSIVSMSLPDAYVILVFISYYTFTIPHNSIFVFSVLTNMPISENTSFTNAGNCGQKHQTINHVKQAMLLFSTISSVHFLVVNILLFFC